MCLTRCRVGGTHARPLGSRLVHSDFWQRQTEECMGWCPYGAEFSAPSIAAPPKISEGKQRGRVLRFQSNTKPVFLNTLPTEATGSPTSSGTNDPPQLRFQTLLKRVINALWTAEHNSVVLPGTGINCESRSRLVGWRCVAFEGLRWRSSIGRAPVL